LIEAIAKKMAPTPTKLRADFELTCFSYEGIDALRDTLLTAKKEVNDDHIQVAVSLTNTD
jgi:translation initiation factor 2 subunit 1